VQVGPPSMQVWGFPRMLFKPLDAGLPPHGRFTYVIILLSELSSSSPPSGSAFTYNPFLAPRFSSSLTSTTPHQHLQPFVASLSSPIHWEPLCGPRLLLLFGPRVHAYFEQRSRGRRNADSKGRESFRRPLSPLRVLPFRAPLTFPCRARSNALTPGMPNSNSVLKF
jgi:hypothetical protein